jgi:hypothetical protein
MNPAVMRKGIRLGHVTSIRVSPKNCMAVIDLLRMADVPTEGMSFASAVSRALDLALTGLIKAGHLPDRDGFEYSEMMAPFGLGINTSTVKDAQGRRVAEMFEAPPVAEKPEPISPTITLEDAKRGLKELLRKHGDSDEVDTWPKEDKTLYDQYVEIIYG